MVIERRSPFASILMLFVVLNSAETFAQSDAAQRNKDLGDQYVAQEKFAEAADAFEQALSGGRDQFTLDERVRMAIYISWENRLDAAVDELRRDVLDLECAFVKLRRAEKIFCTAVFERVVQRTSLFDAIGESCCNIGGRAVLRAQPECGAGL